jgi:hypothetical protein
MKLSSLKNSNTSGTPELAGGRYTAVLASIVHVGLQKGYEEGSPNVNTYAFTFRFINGVEIVKRVSLSLHPASTLSAIIAATGVDPDTAELSDLVGKGIALEVTGGKWPKIEGYCQLESFDEPATEMPTLFVEDIDSVELTKELVMKMNTGTRQLLSTRIRTTKEA